MWNNWRWKRPIEIHKFQEGKNETLHVCFCNFPFARLLHASFKLYQTSLVLPVGDRQLWGWTHSLRVLSLNPGQCMIYEYMRGQVDFQMMEILGDKMNCKWWKYCQSTSVLINDWVRSQEDLIPPDDSLVGFYKLAVPSNLDCRLPCCQIIKLIILPS